VTTCQHCGAEMPAETIQGNVPALALTFAVTPLSAPFCALLAILATAVALWSARRGGSSATKPSPPVPAQHDEY